MTLSEASHACETQALPISPDSLARAEPTVVAENDQNIRLRGA